MSTPRFTSRTLRLLPALLVASALAGACIPADPPPPPVVTPGAVASAPPSDAIVLFSGADLSAWRSMDESPAKWKAENGLMIAAPGAGNIRTADTFGDCQLHVEFRMPDPAKGEGQDRGNSGVYIQARYEVQILDSFNSETYPDGQCAAIYKKHAPLVNACRPPGQWQTYDIIFRAAKFDAAGKKTADATITVFHNGVLVQDHATADGPTGSSGHSEDSTPGPIMLQDHGHPVAYRNIWLRKL